MTTTVQQLQEKIAGLAPDARIFVTGTSGEDYPITQINLNVSNGLTILVEDELPEPREDNQDDDE